MRRLLVPVLVALAIGVGVAVLKLRPAHAPVQQVSAPDHRVAVSSSAAGTPTLGGRTERRPPPSTDVEQGRVAASPRKVGITFEDGTTIPVELRPIRLAPAPFPVPARLADRYAELVRMAQQGDGAAARSLHKWLGVCQRAYGDETSLHNAIARLHADRVVISPDATRPPIVLPVGADVKEFEKLELRRPYEFCSGITAQQKAEAPRWLDVAVQAGDFQAVQEYAVQLGDTAEALKIWDTLWQEQGFRGSLSPLAIRYSNGVAGGPPDYVRAYAYKLIELKLLEAAYQDSASPNSRNMLGAMQESLRYTGGFLDPQQTAAATALAKQLLAENPNCCSGSIFGVAY
jgi:hypothetical protein